MNNVWRLFRFDLGRLKANVMSIIITLGLVLVPSLFAWYNIIACWNVFDNTGNLTVAVANTDEGYQSDLIPLRINIGDQVVSALRANDQIDWHVHRREGRHRRREVGALLRRRGDPEELQPRHAHLLHGRRRPRRYRLLRQREEERHRAEDHRPGSRLGVLPGERRCSPRRSPRCRSRWPNRFPASPTRTTADGRIAVVADHVREMADARRRRVRGAFALRLARLAPARISRAIRPTWPPRPPRPWTRRCPPRRVRADAVPATVDALKSSADDRSSSSLADSAAAFGAVSDSVDALFDARFRGQSGHCRQDLRAQADALASQCDGVPPGRPTAWKALPRSAAREPPAPE